MAKMEFKNKIEKILLEVNKPSRYIGGEIGSLNKDWDSAVLKTVIAFPDLYEIGVSNLGQRILYNIVNNYKAQDFLADRVYAPDVDFRDKLAKNGLPLYGLESFKPIGEFDIVAFSLQYELSYPTILSMLELSSIPIRNIDRQQNHPIVIAGGPGSYNPEPVSEFIDAFIVGDGEDIFIELLENILASRKNNESREKILKNLSKVDGIYVPRFYTPDEKGMPLANTSEVPNRVNKRISNLETHPLNFPIPYSSSVHDRAVIEIRRGCGRMCRFCQSCFVNLPVREREPDNVIEITEKVLKNTGYEEYSLLSLSSSDYKNIEKLVCVLNQKHAKDGASISLPSQRADAFSLELANEVQSVRKSTLTFAPEAGSQRLRDVINKNLNEEQIIKAVLSAYTAGWSKVKLYFMIGLPTETFEDLDEIMNLLRKIKHQAKELKQSENLRHNIELTCTMSIFVPKPFTPFQWCAQDSLELINKKISYLRDKMRFVKGVRLNFHDSFLCQLEAVFARGDRKLNELLELVYKKGSYLDAWTEHFNRGIWYEAAKEMNIDLLDYSTKKFEVEDNLPWDMIETGVKKSWLIQEYKKSFDNQVSVPCEEACSDCGVCETFSKKPVILSTKAISKNEADCPLELDSGSPEHEMLNQVQHDVEIYKYRLKIQKIGNLKYISHLDWQRMIYMAVRKAEIKINFSQGFNPSPKISVGLALPLFVESINEYVDLEIKEKMEENILKERLNKYLPENSQIFKIVKLSKGEKSVDNTVNWAKYSALTLDRSAIEKIDLENLVKDSLARENIFVEKNNSKSFKKIKKDVNTQRDIRPLIYSVEVKEHEDTFKLEFVLKTGQGAAIDNMPTNEAVQKDSAQNIGGSLRADKFLEFLTPQIKWNITRESLLDKNFRELV